MNNFLRHKRWWRPGLLLPCVHSPLPIIRVQLPTNKCGTNIPGSKPKSVLISSGKHQYNQRAHLLRWLLAFDEWTFEDFQFESKQSVTNGNSIRIIDFFKKYIKDMHPPHKDTLHLIHQSAYSSQVIDVNASITYTRLTLISSTVIIIT